MGADRMLQDNIKIIKIAKKHIEEILYKLVVKKRQAPRVEWIKWKEKEIDY